MRPGLRHAPGWVPIGANGRRLGHPPGAAVGQESHVVPCHRDQLRERRAQVPTRAVRGRPSLPGDGASQGGSAGVRGRCSRRQGGRSPGSGRPGRAPTARLTSTPSRGRTASLLPEPRSLRGHGSHVCSNVRLEGSEPVEKTAWLRTPRPGTSRASRKHEGLRMPRRSAVLNSKHPRLWSPQSRGGKGGTQPLPPGPAPAVLLFPSKA